MTERSKQFANRDDPIPVLSFSGSKEESNGRDNYSNGISGAQQSPQTPVRHAGSLEVPKRRFGASVTAKSGDAGNEGPKTGDEKGEKKSWKSFSTGSGSIQDQLYKLLLQSVVASEEVGSGSSWQSTQTGMKTERPAFSLPVMSTNFRRFNARIGVAFAFQNRLMKLFSWRYPTQTLSFLAIYSFICLDPSLLPVLPITLCIFFITIPSYLVRHPASPIKQHDLSNSSKSTHSSNGVPVGASSSSHRSSYFFNNFTDNINDADSNYDSTSSPSSQSQYHLPSRSPIQTPPTNPPATIRPAPETSRDFFRNMRDLQNSMEDFSRLHDTVIASVTPLTNFSDEARSSALFVVLALFAGILIGARHVIPWRAILLAAGWVATGIGHPGVQRWLMGLVVAISTETLPVTSAGGTGAGAGTSSPAAKANRADDPPPSFRSVTARLYDKAHVLVSRWIADDVILHDTSNDSYDDDDNHIITDNNSNIVNNSQIASAEKHQVEIFELQKQQKQNQKRKQQSNVSRYSTYSPSIFSPSPFPPGSSKSSDTTSTSTSLSSILPPPGPFRWADERWTLDTQRTTIDDQDKHTMRRRNILGETGMVLTWVRERGLQDVMGTSTSMSTGDDLQSGSGGGRRRRGIDVVEEKVRKGGGVLADENATATATATITAIFDDEEGNSRVEDDQGWVVDLVPQDDDDDDDGDGGGGDFGNSDAEPVPSSSSSPAEKNIWRRRRWVRSVVGNG